MRLAILIPAYNEELSIKNTINTLSVLIKDYTDKNLIDKSSYILIVDDGSTDNTWNKILESRKENKLIKAIKFSKNFGNQNAIMAGYKKTEEIGCDMVVTIDADLQQDESKIKDFIENYKKGYEIVCGVRKSYNNKYSLKSITSNLFYKLINILGVNLKPGHSEYRLIGKKALKIINEYKEVNIFVRGMIYDLGLKTKFIPYDIRERKYGESKFNFLSLSKMALSAIVSFSTRPLKFVFCIGAFISVISMILALIMAIQLIFQIKLLSHSVPPFEVWETFATGVEILCIGIIGEYISQTLAEAKKRPRYVIDEELI